MFDLPADPSKYPLPPGSQDIMSAFFCQWTLVGNTPEENCGKRFVNAEDLFHHLANEHVGRKPQGNLCLTCHWSGCGRVTDKRDHIISHLHKHVPDYRPFGCEQCSRTFSRASDLRKHYRVHEKLAEDVHDYSGTHLPTFSHGGPTNTQPYGTFALPASGLVQPHSFHHTGPAMEHQQSFAAAYGRPKPLMPGTIRTRTETVINPIVSAPAHHPMTQVVAANIQRQIQRQRQLKLNALHRNQLLQQDFNFGLSQPHVQHVGSISQYDNFRALPSASNSMMPPTHINDSVNKPTVVHKRVHEELSHSNSVEHALSSFIGGIKRNKLSPKYSEEIASMLNTISNCLEYEQSLQMPPVSLDTKAPSQIPQWPECIPTEVLAEPELHMPIKQLPSVDSVLQNMNNQTLSNVSLKIEPSLVQSAGDFRKVSNFFSQLCQDIQLADMHVDSLSETDPTEAHLPGQVLEERLSREIQTALKKKNSDPFMHLEDYSGLSFDIASRVPSNGFESMDLDHDMDLYFDWNEAERSPQGSHRIRYDILRRGLQGLTLRGKDSDSQGAAPQPFSITAENAASTSESKSRYRLQHLLSDPYYLVRSINTQERILSLGPRVSMQQRALKRSNAIIPPVHMDRPIAPMSSNSSQSTVASNTSTTSEESLSFDYQRAQILSKPMNPRSLRRSAGALPQSSGNESQTALAQFSERASGMVGAASETHRQVQRSISLPNPVSSRRANVNRHIRKQHFALIRRLLSQLELLWKEAETSVNAAVQTV